MPSIQKISFGWVGRSRPYLATNVRIYSTAAYRAQVGLSRVAANMRWYVGAVEHGTASSVNRGGEPVAIYG